MAESPKKFQCTVCGLKYASTSILNRHTRSEHENLRFKCPYCPKEYKRKADLQRHQLDCLLPGLSAPPPSARPSGTNALRMPIGVFGQTSVFRIGRPQNSTMSLNKSTSRPIQTVQRIQQKPGQQEQSIIVPISSSCITSSPASNAINIISEAGMVSSSQTVRMTTSRASPILTCSKMPTLTMTQDASLPSKILEDDEISPDHTAEQDEAARRKTQSAEAVKISGLPEGSKVTEASATSDEKAKSVIPMHVIINSSPVLNPAAQRSVSQLSPSVSSSPNIQTSQAGNILFVKQIRAPSTRSTAIPSSTNSTIVVMSQSSQIQSQGSVIISNKPSIQQSTSGQQNAKSSEVKTPVKPEDSQNALLKQLLQNSGSSVTSPLTRTNPSLITTQRAPSLGVFSSLEAQLARPVIPPVPAKPIVVTSQPLVNQIAMTPIPVSTATETVTKSTTSTKVVSPETSFVSQAPSTPTPPQTPTSSAIVNIQSLSEMNPVVVLNRNDVPASMIQGSTATLGSAPLNPAVKEGILKKKQIVIQEDVFLPSWTPADESKTATAAARNKSQKKTSPVQQRPSTSGKIATSTTKNTQPPSVVVKKVIHPNQIVKEKVPTAKIFIGNKMLTVPVLGQLVPLNSDVQLPTRISIQSSQTMKSKQVFVTSSVQSIPIDSEPIEMLGTRQMRKDIQMQNVVQSIGQPEEIDELNSDGSWVSEDDPDRLWCICRQPHNNSFMIECESCKDWFHGACVSVTKTMVKEFERVGKEWHCPACHGGARRPFLNVQNIVTTIIPRSRQPAPIEPSEPATENQENELESQNLANDENRLKRKRKAPVWQEMYDLRQFGPLKDEKVLKRPAPFINSQERKNNPNNYINVFKTYPCKIEVLKVKRAEFREKAARFFAIGRIPDGEILFGGYIDECFGRPEAYERANEAKYPLCPELGGFFFYAIFRASDFDTLNLADAQAVRSWVVTSFFYVGCTRNCTQRAIDHAREALRGKRFRHKTSHERECIIGEPMLSVFLGPYPENVARHFEACVQRGFGGNNFLANIVVNFCTLQTNDTELSLLAARLMLNDIPECLKRGTYHCDI